MIMSGREVEAFRRLFGNPKVASVLDAIDDLFPERRNPGGPRTTSSRSRTPFAIDSLDLAFVPGDPAPESRFVYLQDDHVLLDRTGLRSSGRSLPADARSLPWAA